MFSIRKYHEITPCIQGKELLTHILETTGITRLWLSADHIFLATNSGGDLYAFDVVPQLKWRSLPAKPKECVLNTNQEPTIEVIWSKTEPSLIYVVSESGTTGLWEFLRPSHEWIKHKSFQLSNAKGARIVDVRLHEETGNIVWCERRGLGEGTYCVCCRSISGNLSNEKSKTELGTTQAILHNCPPIQIFSFTDGICIHPCQLYLETFCIFWSARKDVKAVIFKDGKVEESVDCGSDFRDIATELIGYWSTNECNFKFLGMTVHPSSQDLLILNYNGLVSKVCVKSNLVKSVAVCRIELPPSAFENIKDIKIFTNEMKFGLIDHYGVIFLYDVVSGKLLDKIKDLSDISEQFLVLNSCSAVPTTVFWNQKGFWKLESPSLSELVKTVSRSQLGGKDGRLEEEEAVDDTSKTSSINDNLFKVNPQVEDSPPKGLHETETANPKVFGFIDIAVWFSVYGLDHSAAVFLLDHIISCLANRMELPETIVHILQKLSKIVFQNPTILLALHDKRLSLEDDSLIELKHFLEELDQSTVPSPYITPLNIQIQPFLHELFNVMSRLREVPLLEMSKLNNVLGESTGIDVDTALQSVVSGIADANYLDKMEILSLQEPGDAVQGFLPVNGESFDVKSKGAAGKISEILRDELKDRRWKRRRNPDNAIVLGSLFKLLYKNHPEVLLDILELAKTCVRQGASKNEATLMDLEECIRDFIVEFLPSVWSEKECDLKRINIHSELLVRLGLQQDAMELLLQRKQWERGVDLYIELSHRSTDQRFTAQLYAMLLAGILRGSGTSQTPLLVKLFELKPEIVDIHDLFQLCLRNVPQNNVEEILDEGVLTVKDARKALGQFLQKT